MAERTDPISVRLKEETRDAVEEFAQEKGLTRTDAIELLIMRGLANGSTPEEIQRLFDDMRQALLGSIKDEMGAFAEAGRAHEESMARAIKEVTLAEKQIGNGTQAALANLAFSVWNAKAVVGNLFEEIPAQTYKSAEYLVSEVKVNDIYNWFWNIGGALRRDPRPPKFYPAFAQTEKLMSGYDCESLVGVDAETWARITGVNDTEATASLARKDAPSKNDKKRHGYRGGNDGRK